MCNTVFVGIYNGGRQECIKQKLFNTKNDNNKQYDIESRRKQRKTSEKWWKYYGDNNESSNRWICRHQMILIYDKCSYTYSTMYKRSISVHTTSPLYSTTLAQSSMHKWCVADNQFYCVISIKTNQWTVVYLHKVFIVKSVFIWLCVEYCLFSIFHFFKKKNVTDVCIHWNTNQTENNVNKCLKQSKVNNWKKKNLKNNLKHLIRSYYFDWWYFPLKMQTKNTSREKGLL